MKKWVFTAVLAGVCLMFAASARAAPLIETTWGLSEPQSASVAQGANDFAFRLSAALLKNVGDENFVVSPYSVWLPLVALINATDEAHRQEFIEILAGEGLLPEDINRAASRMLFDLTNERHRRRDAGDGFGNNPLQIANAVFVDYRHTLRAEFAQIFMDYFRGEAMNVDFSSPTAVAAVNQWASDKTDGLIDEVIQEFDPDTAAAIANAIYFSDSWLDEFNPGRTERDVFHSPAGDVYAYFMRQEWQHTMYFEDERMQSVTLPFATGGGMTILLPKDGDAVGLLSDMTNEEFDRIRDHSVSAGGSLLLPRFSVENTLGGLIPALSSLGLEALFCEITAPIDGLIYYPHPCWIDQAVQVAMIEVDEEGATAAAVTVMVLIPQSAPPMPEVTFEMVCNTPFAFILYRRTEDGGRQVLFTGVVNNPS